MKYGIYNFKQLMEFIRENGIKTRSELSSKFQTVYIKSFLPLTEKEKNILLPLSHHYYNHLNSKDDFKRFFEKNNVVTRSDLSRRFERCYVRFMKVLTEEEQDEILPSLVLQNYTYLKTKDDFKKFLNNNNVKSRRDLEIRFKKAYVRFRKILTTKDKDELLPLQYRNYSNLVDYKSLKTFIENNNVLSRKDFNVRFQRAYDRFKTRLTYEEQDLLLPTVNSLGEEFLRKLFSDNLIVFETEKTYADLCSEENASLRYDFYLTEYGILVEYHGVQHFDPNNKYYTEDGIKRDKLKFDYAKKNNIPILYFTYEKNLYEKFGYFTDVITDSDILIEKIKEIKISLTN